MSSELTLKRTDPSSALLRWHSHPLFDDPARSMIALVMLGVFLWVLWDIAVNDWGEPAYFTLGCIVMFLSLITFFFPTSYAFFDQKIEITYLFVTVRRPFSDFKCFYADRKGVMLSSFRRPRRLDMFRGQSIRFSKEKTEKDQLLALLKERIERQF